MHSLFYQILLSGTAFLVPEVSALPSYARSNHWTVGQAINTTSGLVIGHPSRLLSNVSEYLGIRYANPAVGRLRFSAPTPFKGNGFVYVASNFVSVHRFRILELPLTYLVLQSALVVERRAICCCSAC